MVASRSLAYGLARMYASYRELTGGTRLMGVFHDEESAWRWLALSYTEAAAAQTDMLPDWSFSAPARPQRQVQPVPQPESAQGKAAQHD